MTSSKNLVFIMPLHPVEITADNCETLNTEITITADTATHTQTFTLTYKDADYKKVDEAIEKANALKKDDYKDFSAVQEAIDKVIRGKNITEQAEVDQMAKKSRLRQRNHRRRRHRLRFRIRIR